MTRPSLEPNMIKRTLFITALLFAANQAHAEASWFDSALNFLGMGEEKTAPAEQKTDAMTQTGSTDETIAKVTEMATAASKTMAKNTAMSWA